MDADAKGPSISFCPRVSCYARTSSKPFTLNFLPSRRFVHEDLGLMQRQSKDHTLALRFSTLLLWGAAKGKRIGVQDATWRGGEIRFH